MQAVFGEHKSTKLFHELFAFDESLTSTNLVPDRYVYPVCPGSARPSIIPNPDYKAQVTPPRRGRIVPPEVLTASTLLLGVSRRKQNTVIPSSGNLDERAPFSSSKSRP